MSTPNRPKARPPGQHLIPDDQRRRRLGGSFAGDLSLEQAREYDAMRPRYPADAVEAILAVATPDDDGAASAHPTVADLGAGTGILTRQLLDVGAAVHAVEPSATMLEVLAEAGTTHHSERLALHQAAAEETGLQPASVDIAVAAQAWHWFDPDRIQAELARILVPGGAIAVVGNYLDTSVPWVHRLTRIMRAGDVYRPEWAPHLDPARFTAVTSDVLAHGRELRPAEIMRLATTLSSWLAADEADRARRRANLTWYLYEHLGHDDDAALTLPYLTTLHTARRSGAA